MDRGAWWAMVHGVTKESDTTEQLNSSSNKAFLQMCSVGHAAPGEKCAAPLSTSPLGGGNLQGTAR